MASGTQRRRVNTLFTVIYSRQSLSGKRGDVKEDFLKQAREPDLNMHVM